MATIFITGSTDGLGRAAAQSLLDLGHRVVLHARSADRGNAVGELRSRAQEIVVGDLSSAAETKAIADQVNAIGRMDAIIHNAGVYTRPGRGATAEGHAETLAINTLAPYMLTALIGRPGRLVYLSSGLHRGGEGSLGDLDWTRRSWDAAKAYAESKLQIVALAFALARRWPKVMSNAVDPGWVRTKMGGAGAPVDIETGARTQSWLAASEDPAALISGRYWHHLAQQQPAREATDPEFQDELIGKLGKLTGVELPGV
ncbi:SDR family NAD(P)-dependent oxidoreductase [Bradyrhizobium symbiodeficiens]|uniref:SDR family NAD(P)-dependent oxidoreductase n=1 Tax=Bradyrhizobium symbiodeficiens TaxID=1404367 RepID=UPI00140FE48D|nr:SDR family NAD(P)-dependent oxidoreductase [Bradyrhizobium symbiodeficiens]QIO98641.1 SDR family NAD(P)-dependent oxidoreductase [Bradyrhizobium symbiodeficiens]